MNIINEKVVEYLNGLYKALRPEIFEIRKYAERNHIPVILQDTETLIVSLLKVKRPKRILEIGTAIGYSASCFAEACSTAEIVTIESSVELKNMAVNNIEMLGYQNQITVLLGNATDVLKEMEEGFKYTHSKNKKAYLALNIFAHNEDISILTTYLQSLKTIPIDAFIVSDPGVVMLIKSILPNAELHLSTQANM